MIPQFDTAASRERALAMLRLLQRGDTLADVAAIYDVSRERVRQLVRKHFPAENWRARGRPKKAE